jgi:maltose alpha-D-glucosyltransferase/alpha-amylase
VLTAEVFQEARWFGGKSRTIVNTRIVDRAHWADSAGLQLVEVSYTSGPSELYVLADRLEDPSVARAILDHFHGSTIATERGGHLVFRPTHVFQSAATQPLEPVQAMKGEQSNTSIRFGDALILKLFRRMQFGPNPDVEIGWYLTEHTGFSGTPPVAGSLSYVRADGCEASLALLQCFERNRGDAWTTTLRRLQPVLEGADQGESLDAVRRLGATTAELHVALAGGSGPDFEPEPISARDVVDWLAVLQEEVRITVEALAARGIAVDSAPLPERAEGLREVEGALKTRHHGDYHLGQVLERDDGAFVIIDFEGEPSRQLAQRREKRPPLRDVAGMLRSFDYARTAALRAGNASDPGRLARAAAWHAAAREAFLSEYLAIARRLPYLLPSDVEPPLAALELEKAAYEVVYELNNRPDWLPIPLAAFTSA